jgi:hypothetical protein
MQRVKTLRHPSIIKFKDAILGDDCALLVTEPVIPLSYVLLSLPMEEIIIGIYNILVKIFS